MSFLACAKSIDFFLRPEQAQALRDLHNSTAVDVGLANDSTIQVSQFSLSLVSMTSFQLTHSSTRSQNFVNEAPRPDPAVGGFVRQAQSNVTLGGTGPNSVQIKSGTLVYVDWTKVNRDPAAFAQPEQIKTDRNPTLYKLAEPGIRSCEPHSPVPPSSSESTDAGSSRW
jgi:cytochrome P450